MDSRIHLSREKKRREKKEVDRPSGEMAFPTFLSFIDDKKKREDLQRERTPISSQCLTRQSRLR